jgi:hypothetical protein
MQNDWLNRVAIYFIQIICAKSLINPVFAVLGWIDCKYNFKNCLHFLRLPCSVSRSQVRKIDVWSGYLCVSIEWKWDKIEWWILHLMSNFMLRARSLRSSTNQLRSWNNRAIVFSIVIKLCSVWPRVLVDSYLRCGGSYLANCTLTLQSVISTPDALRTSSVMQYEYILCCLAQNKPILLPFFNGLVHKAIWEIYLTLRSILLRY